MSSLRRGDANLLCIVPILSDDPRKVSVLHMQSVLFFCFVQLSSLGAFAYENLHNRRQQRFLISIRSRPSHRQIGCVMPRPPLKHPSFALGKHMHQIPCHTDLPRRSSTNPSNGGMSLLQLLPEVSCSPLHCKRHVTQAHPSWQKLAHLFSMWEMIHSQVCPFENAMVMASCVSDLLLACLRLSSRENCWSLTDRPSFAWARKKLELILRITLLKRSHGLWDP